MKMEKRVESNKGKTLYYPTREIYIAWGKKYIYIYIKQQNENLGKTIKKETTFTPVI